MQLWAGKKIPLPSPEEITQGRGGGGGCVNKIKISLAVELIHLMGKVF